MHVCLTQIYTLFAGDQSWIPWNLALAGLPLALSGGLFRDHRQGRSWLWWLGWTVFLVVLPNAPYLVTDSVHLRATMQAGLSVWRLTLEVLPVQLGAILAGCEAYVVCVMRQERYIRRHGAPQLVVWTGLLTHALCAVGIYLGRVQRFNSWDVLLQPGQVLLRTMQALTTARPLGVIGVTFGMLTLGYWGMKHLTLGMRRRFRATCGRRARWV